MQVLQTVSVLVLTFISCHSLPLLSHFGNTLDNNSFIYFANISSEGGALKCVTDNITCCNGSGSNVGNWKDERGRLVQDQDQGMSCMYVTRKVENGEGVINLNRKANCSPSPGLWSCDIPDSVAKMQSFYVYISNDTNFGEHLLCLLVSKWYRSIT